MAQISVKYRSEALIRNVSFDIYLPNDKPDEKGRKMKTLFLLHGYTGDAWNWVKEELAQKYHFAVVTPNGENGFWLDGLSTGHKYATLVGEEIVDYLRRTFLLAMSREETYILGLSMGGFGALHTGLYYPETFGKIGAMSSALIVHEVAKMQNGKGNDTANYDYYRECFGEPKELLQSRNNPETLIDQLLQEKKEIPEIYMCCGTEDFLLENNREFHTFLCDRKVPHQYMESAGNHDMKFWDEYTEKIVTWMFEE